MYLTLQILVEYYAWKYGRSFPVHDDQTLFFALFSGEVDEFSSLSSEGRPCF